MFLFILGAILLVIGLLYILASGNFVDTTTRAQSWAILCVIVGCIFIIIGTIVIRVDRREELEIRRHCCECTIREGDTQ
jgi:drug/metabolite transporter (DMT)-like permease